MLEPTFTAGRFYKLVSKVKRMVSLTIKKPWNIINSRYTIKKVSYMWLCTKPFSRKKRDSNPRNSYPFTAFRVRPARPLRHFSVFQRCQGNIFFWTKQRSAQCFLLLLKGALQIARPRCGVRCCDEEVVSKVIVPHFAWCKYGASARWRNRFLCAIPFEPHNPQATGDTLPCYQNKPHGLLRI